MVVPDYLCYAALASAPAPASTQLTHFPHPTLLNLALSLSPPITHPNPNPPTPKIHHIPRQRILHLIPNLNPIDQPHNISNILPQHLRRHAVKRQQMVKPDVGQLAVQVFDFEEHCGRYCWGQEW